MKKIIKILIGDKPESSKVTLIYPEYKRIPSEYIPDVDKLWQLRASDKWDNVREEH